MKPEVEIQIPGFPPARLIFPEGTSAEEMEEWRAAWDRKMQDPAEVARIQERYRMVVLKEKPL